MIDGVTKAGQFPSLQIQPSTGGSVKATGTSESFEAVLKGLAAQSVGAMHKSEMTAMAGLRGEATIQQVVDQVMAAERNLMTALAIRNKIVAAYQEISRMAI